jgi:glycosyltransferase involved in cell wall biosynthesis
MISGFMIVKDVLKTGYPFAEAIASALRVCDEFLISDGYSTDGTYEVVKQISNLNNKVRIFRSKWPNTKSITILADVTNEVRKKCKYDYIFYVQANEIVHEESVRFIKALPEMRPDVNTFSFPYLQLMQNYKYTEEFRLRFSRNLPEIVATGDAWTLGVSRSGIDAKEFACLKNPKKFFFYLGHGIDYVFANPCTSPLTRAIYLPKPMFRYWSLFPRNHVEKCIKHKEMFNLQEFTKTINILKNRMDEDPQTFWKDAVNLARDGLYVSNPVFNYPEDLERITINEHPKIIQSMIKDTALKSYHVRDEILDLIKTL